MNIDAQNQPAGSTRKAGVDVHSACGGGGDGRVLVTSAAGFIGARASELLLEWKPTTDWRAGVAEFVAWYDAEHRWIGTIRAAR
ncbi:hypothetical protein [Actinopolymorpha rutila]|uniref:Uncharacterized protein n=1 Tax=Actinopolymorpha rutila TaxID=446787 RepID=A0A852ZF32_9ACTN|nr:hypothetical protein [Actinopolymorpha rutila]NYH90893.1 hypothetical protein [Actinopolymorpha rutila]